MAAAAYGGRAGGSSPGSNGPTYGPPAPIGLAPPGWTYSVAVSETARARLSRPLPVDSSEPTASAVRARRDTMTPLEAPGSMARNSAAAAATMADEAEVPETLVEPPPGTSVVMSVPGAARNTLSPR